jgi:hypothetical protein
LFKRDHHVRIATILQALDAKKLLDKGCLFGGGTAIVLKRGEYRESVDIDFIISNLVGYRDLRQELRASNDLTAIVREGQELNLSREIRSDQYGIRTMIDQGGVEVKFEIVLEGRIQLQLPLPKDKICGVATLTEVDMAASKLLANSDRWFDDAVFSRDLIDIAMMELSSKKFEEAKSKAKSAYGDSVEKDLAKAIEGLKGRPGRLSECMSTLSIEGLPEAVLWEKIRKLK